MEAIKSQAGYFTARQAREAGYSWRMHTYHVQRGNWIRVDRGLFRLRDYPPGRHEDLVRWSLWSLGRAVVSHDTAASLHELGDLMPGRIHLTVPPGFRKSIPPVIVVHRTRLPASDILDGEGFRVTTPLRTIQDLLMSVTEPERVAAVVRDALDRGGVRRAVLDPILETLDLEYRDRARRILALAEH